MISYYKKVLYFVTWVILLFTNNLTANPDIIGVDEIKRGMKGYGLTVFEGTRVEKFSVEVVSVVPNFRLRQSIILVRLKHPVTDKAGVIGGMSGSPIYIEGKLAGALAYGWKFNKESLAGVTPIAKMLEITKRKNSKLITDRAGSYAEKLNPAFKGQFAGLSFSLNNNAYSKEGQVQIIATPVTLGGFSRFAADFMWDSLRDFGIEPVSGGGGKIRSGQKKFTPGSSIGVQLIRGDMSATAIGTVTLILGNKVLAFGHPMFNMGLISLPVTTAKIHTVIASYARSNKIGSPLNVAGRLVQDRKAGIMARTDLDSFMIPVNVSVEDELTGRKDKYQVEIANHQKLTTKLLRAAILNIVSDAASDVRHVTAKSAVTIKLKGKKAFTLHDSGVSNMGLKKLAINGFKSIKVINDIINNPFEIAEIEKLDFDILLRYELEEATIFSSFVTSSLPEPGDTISVNVRLKKYNDDEQIISIPITIPQTAAGKTIKIEVGGGDRISPVTPLPYNLDGIIDNALRYYPSNSIVTGIYVPEVGLSLRGRILNQLPLSAMETIIPSAGFDMLTVHDQVIHKVNNMPFIVTGKHSLKVNVQEKSIK